MEKYKDIESLLALRVEAKASDNLRKKIADTKPQNKHIHRWAIAASIAIIFCLGVAAAGVWFTSSENSERSENSEYSEISETTAPAPDFFIFDNVELQQVADTLGKHYRLKPIFENEAVKKLRIYLKVNKQKTIQELVEQLNQFDEINVTASDSTLTIK